MSLPMALGRTAGLARRDAGVAYLAAPYAAATFARASPAAAWDPRTGLFYLTGAGAQLADNVPRILPDGAILLEETRENRVRSMRDFGAGTWTTLNSPTLTGGEYPAPDGGAQAWSVEWASSASAGQVRDTLGGTPADNARIAWSIFARCNADVTQTLRGGIRDKAAATVTDFYPVVGNAFQRIEDNFGAGVGSFQLIYLLIENDGNPADKFGFWGAQMEVGLWPSSPIYSAGAATTRAVEQCTYDPADVVGLREGVQRWRVWPSFGSGGADTPATTQTAHVYEWSSGNYGLVLRRTTGGAGLVFHKDTAGGTLCLASPVSWSRGQALSIIYHPITGDMVLEGFTTGDGSYSATGTPYTPGAGESLRIGRRAAATDPFSGVIGRAEAA